MGWPRSTVNPCRSRPGQRDPRHGLGSPSPIPTVWITRADSAWRERPTPRPGLSRSGPADLGLDERDPRHGLRRPRPNGLFPLRIRSRRRWGLRWVTIGGGLLCIWDLLLGLCLKLV
uniref:Uncharacterized protein n=1 Tax=Fagus sylvatica TaxID=28930 RepID=A0A2N9G8Q3_FAGSY